MPMLPEQFADLEPFAAKWCIENQNDRYDIRLASSMDEMQALYDAALPRLEEALKYLDQFKLEEIPQNEQNQNLLWLCYSLCQVSFPVEVWRQQRVPDSGAAEIIQTAAPAV